MGLKLLAASMLALLSPGVATASNSINGNVTGFASLADGTVLVYSSGTRDTPASCSNGQWPTRWAFDGKTVEGQEMLSILLMSHALHTPVNLYGTNNCSVLPDAETVSFLITDNSQ